MTLGKVLATAGVALCAGLGLGPAQAVADDWFPHPAGATWTYKWSDTKYNTSGTVEQVKVAASAACGWQVDWTGTTQVSVSGSAPSFSQPDNGTMCFQDQTTGLVNTNWSATSPPFNEPPLCPTSAQCSNSLGSSLFDVIWGTRSPVVSEPLLKGTTWTAAGGGDNSVTSTNEYLGQQLIKVPAYPNGVVAAVVRSQIALAGTPGDDYGSGIRTIWWVYGIGPVHVVFDHVNGAVTRVDLQTTSLKTGRTPPDTNYFPLTRGLKNTYRWTNDRHMTAPEVETVTVAASLNRTARLSVKSVSGPIRAAGSYIFGQRLDGVRSTYGSSSAATTLKFPPFGHGRHFFSPMDMVVYGFGPVLPAYGIPGSVWHSGNAYDFSVYGVTGTSRVVGVRSVTVPAGTFQALVVTSDLRQAGFPYGGGSRTMWFAPGRGLVKLTFKHRDGSSDSVALIK